MPPEHVAWDKLSLAEKGSVNLLLLSLDEFAAAHDVAKRIQVASPFHVPLLRFITNSVHHYLHAYYPTSRQMGAYAVLTKIGRDDLIDAIEAILEQTVASESVLAFVEK